ncbi:dsDNA nuclease domain-containing protein [Klebsiella pneumoniae]|uniref:HamA C-terminal domain-containing protein n=1 Tax=Klebsiella pneumoniae TaxID=573 RepID=UPI001D0EF145|nr:dsDNA nuclease domain-containing protein [Klebsiella pneumoniae]MDW2591298.1 dsDNA nuclease domain-containing protein [Klebsiella pneumoniae]MDW2616081.1 dsDNA nuclease domain-containing protein [Klebsiella pneumoniae]MDW2621217.1 dsDNA nuclease domain-containing protein [Klebsiella pneumoniae]MDW2693414.1 dsDNA nuclease domain-containing protein [Klebsiella pneumoniae]MDW2713094.1 dsDNA nuclease domain-containing protein [Klebsiella pneumoniae]
MMSITSLSDAGGPAARQGFKYQDHVAVSFIFKMLQDSNYSQVECETADDIVAVFQCSGQIVNEYIQVKTTESDSKWNLNEITALDGTKANSSLLHKSLKCDVRPGIARFRIVTKRDVAKILDGFKKEIDKRVLPDTTTARGVALCKKFKTFVSPQKRDFLYWAENFVWQVYGDVEALEAVNIKALSQLAEGLGNRPNFTQLKAIYEEFLEIADKAATSSVKTAAASKIILRAPTLDHLKKLLEEADDMSTATSKPYKKHPDPFLVEFHTNAKESLLHSFSGFDVRYSLRKWRHENYAKHLVEWLPEFSLKASEIVNILAHNAETILARSISTFSDSELPRDRLIAELILHSILRSRQHSEPVACKVFYKSAGKLSEFGNAHIVQMPDQDDQLWLGLARMIKADDMDTTLEQIREILDETISETVLSAEREIIISLREPLHHQPKADSFNQALHRNSPIDDMLNILCFPILLTYDSAALSSGWFVNYVDNLKKEIETHFRAFTSELSENIKQVKVLIFLVPMESIELLTKAFNARCEKLEELQA